MWCYENIQNIKHKEADKNHFQFEFKIIVKLTDGIVIIGDQLQVLTLITYNITSYDFNYVKPCLGLVQL